MSVIFFLYLTIFYVKSTYVQISSVTYFFSAPQASKVAPVSMITMVTIIAGVLGVVVLALIIGVLVVVKRRKQPAHKPQKLLVTDEA